MVKDSEKGSYSSPEGSHKFEYAVTFACFMLMFSLGCEFGFTSPALSVLSAPDTPINVTASDMSTIAAAVAGGQLITPLTVPFFDKIGRKVSLFAVAILVVIGWGLVAIAESVLVLAIGRMIGGFAIGIGLIVGPMYLGEIASVKLRGALGLVSAMAMGSGLLCIYIMVPYLKICKTAYVLGSIGIASTIALCFVPESPYFLALKGKVEEAEEVLEKLRGKTDVTEELEVVKESVMKHREEMRAATSGSKIFKNVMDIFRVRGNRRALLMNISFIFTFYGGGYLAIVSYGPQLFSTMKIEMSEHKVNIMLASIQLICSMLTSLLIDRLGRKPLVLFGGIVCCSCTLIISIYFYLMENTKVDVSGFSNVALFAVVGHITAMSMGLIPVQLVIISESLASEIKASVNMIIGVGGGIVAVLTLKGYMLITVIWDLGHFLPFLIFSIVMCTCVTTILSIMPETKGKTFVEIQKALND